MKRCAAQPLWALFRSPVLLVYWEQLEARAGGQASRYRLPPSSIYTGTSAFIQGEPGLLSKAVVTAPAGATSCQLPKRDQQINRALLQWEPVTPAVSVMLFLNCHNPIQNAGYVLPLLKNVYLRYCSQVLSSIAQNNSEVNKKLMKIFFFP